jgi:hypothetical protein
MAKDRTSDLDDERGGGFESEAERVRGVAPDEEELEDENADESDEEDMDDEEEGTF